MKNNKVILGVLGDTHIPDRLLRLPIRVITEFSDVDLIVHTGDFTERSVYEELQELADVRAVRGNMDEPHIDLPKSIKFELAGRTIGVTHGWGSSRGLERRILAKLQPVDILIYGHSHEPTAKWINSTFLVNPGSCAGNVDGTRSCLLLELGETIKATPISL